MLKCVSLNLRDLKKFYSINKRRGEFNSLNEDFFEYYNTLGWLKQYMQRRNVLLLKHNEDILGYLWMTRSENNTYRISSLFIDSSRTLDVNYSKLMQAVRAKKPLIYCCEKQGSNYELLKTLGFNKTGGTYEMFTSLYSIPPTEVTGDLEFKVLEKHSEEKTRCRIQNEVFKNDTRIPLTLEDMYYDEEQDYYFDKGAVLVKKDGRYIGYGQIIIIDSTPTIVNVGILKEYRGKGYGKALMHYLLKVLKENAYSGVYLKVSESNLPALTLYKSLGFNVLKQVHDFEYKKSGTTAFSREP
jgi:ribosomal protein S18 acetylase RimI-like enzyme